MNMPDWDEILDTILVLITQDSDTQDAKEESTNFSEAA